MSVLGRKLGHTRAGRLHKTEVGFMQLRMREVPFKLAKNAQNGVFHVFGDFDIFSRLHFLSLCLELLGGFQHSMPPAATKEFALLAGLVLLVS